MSAVDCAAKQITFQDAGTLKYDAALLATGLAQNAAEAGMPSVLVGPTVRAAAAFAAGTDRDGA